MPHSCRFCRVGLTCDHRNRWLYQPNRRMTGARSCNRLLPTAFPQQPHHNRLPLPLEVSIPRGSIGPTVPILGIRQVTFFAMQIRMHPRPVRSFVALGGLMCLFPISFAVPPQALLAQRSVPRAASPASMIHEILRCPSTTSRRNLACFLPEHLFALTARTLSTPSRAPRHALGVHRCTEHMHSPCYVLLMVRKFLVGRSLQS